jgi:predicted lipoprotein with Yx(FWY)xxD motif
MRRIIFSLAGAATLAACGAAGATATSGPASTSAPATATTISTGTTSLGTVLTDAKGFTLYYFLPEQNATIGACTGACLTTWPPLVVTGAPTAASGATGTLATVSIMVNGAVQTEVTYNGWPLHTFASDTTPGQTNGEGIAGKWFAATPGTSSTSTGATSASGSTPTPAAATPTASTPGGYGY